MLADDFVEGVQEFFVGIVLVTVGGLVYSKGAGKLEQSVAIDYICRDIWPRSAHLRAAKTQKQFWQLGVIV